MRDWDGRYNNEPFWGAMRDKDQIGMARDAGFPAETIRFDTAPMAIREFANRAKGYDAATVKSLAERTFKAGG